MEYFFDPNYMDIFIKLAVATFLGMLLGVERLYAHKTASMRTYALVSMGASMFILISTTIVGKYMNNANFDPLRMAAQIISGAGFLGAGMIIFQEKKLTGITTAAGLWVSAGIGMACGFGLYTLAIFGTILTLFIFSVLWVIEERLRKITFISRSDAHPEHPSETESV